jgi:hypothetical protein
MSVLNQFLKQVFTGPQLRDFRHANYLFTGNNFELSPKYQFLFFVRITLNPNLTRLSKTHESEIGIMAKTADLPKFSVDVKNFNAYNRPNLVQTKVKYDPITISFHDDSADRVREFWYDYYSFYYRDSDYEPAVYTSGHKYQNRVAKDWGYTPLYAQVYPDEHQLIKDIQIFSFQQKRFSSYTLHNPVITGFRHGNHDHSQGSGTMEHQMTVQYEAVTYQKGFVTPDQFGDMTLRYDLQPSPLTPAGGGTASILGPGGLLGAAGSVGSNLASGNLLGALFVGGRAIQANQGANLGQMAIGELSGIGVGILRGQNPQSRIAVPGISNLVGGAQNSVNGGFNRLGSGGGMASPPGGSNTAGLLAGGLGVAAISGLGGGVPALLAGLGIAALASSRTPRRDTAPANAQSNAVTSNGSPVTQLAYNETSSYNPKFPPIKNEPPATSAYFTPKPSAPSGPANINFAQEALPPSNQQKFPNIGEFI